PPSTPLDVNGMHFLATLAAAVLLWLFEVLDDYLVGLILLLSWLVMGVVPTEVALAGFSKSSWFFVVGALGIGAAVNNSGILNSLAIRLLRGIRVNHKLYKLIFAASGWVMTPLVPEVKARTVLITPLTQAIGERIGFKPCSNGSASLTLSGYVGVSQLTFMFLTGSTYCLVGWSLLPESARGEFDWVTWAVAALPAGVVLFVFLYLSIHFFFPVDERDVVDRPV
ncbi:MAG: hypothetical protein GTO40_04805, partial [Deltaproteobacteria bacterium]|nr:hypothetical protein [Deltaproteobacteria bacterium]